MIVRTQDESAIYDLNKCFCLFATENGEIMALGYDGKMAYTLGKYDSQDRGKEVVEEIYAVIDGQHKYDMPII